MQIEIQGLKETFIAAEKSFSTYEFENPRVRALKRNV